MLPSSDIAGDVVELMKIETRIATRAERNKPQSQGSDEISIDERRRAKQRNDVVGLAHRPEIRRHELAKRIMAQWRPWPWCHRRWYRFSSRSDVTSACYGNGGYVHSMDAGAPRAQLHFVIFSGTDTVLHSPERGVKTSDASNTCFPEREIRADEAHGPFASAD